MLILGVSYKAGVADLREAPALKIIRHLRELGADVSYHDPLVPALRRARPRVGRAGRRPSAAADVVAIVTAHPGIDYEELVERAALVVDFRGVTRGSDAAERRPPLRRPVSLLRQTAAPARRSTG